jgi:hypothetical protein
MESYELPENPINPGMCTSEPTSLCCGIVFLVMPIALFFFFLFLSLSLFCGGCVCDICFFFVLSFVVTVAPPPSSFLSSFVRLFLLFFCGGGDCFFFDFCFWRCLLFFSFSSFCFLLLLWLWCLPPPFFLLPFSLQPQCFSPGRSRRQI